MDEDYLIDRIRTSLEMARSAAGSAARLVHFELAGRYSLLAAKFAADPAPVWLQRFQLGVSSFHRAGPPVCGPSVGGAAVCGSPVCG